MFGMNRNLETRYLSNMLTGFFFFNMTPTSHLDYVKIYQSLVYYFK